jgi:putative glutamine amidotransferase
MTKPLIGIVAERWSSSRKKPDARVQGQLSTYVDAVLGAGGVPIIVPLLPDANDLRQVYASLDGLLLPGGGDLDPQQYLTPPHPATGSIDADRDEVELFLARRALTDRKPLLGVCRGIQLLNVALGGSLYQDLPTEFDGALPHYFHYPEHPLDTPAHNVQVEEDSLLAQCLGQPIVQVNSRHHQAARQVAPGLNVVGRAPDGVIEALELPGHPFALGVQWHPENMQARPEMRGIFVRFVQAALGEKDNW